MKSNVVHKICFTSISYVQSFSIVNKESANSPYREKTCVRSDISVKVCETSYISKLWFPLISVVANNGVFKRVLYYY